MNDTLNTILTQVIEIVIATLTTVVVSVLLPKLRDYITSKIGNEKFKAAISEIETVVATSVQYVNQTLVDDLKKNNKWDAASQKEAFELALKTVMENLSTETKSYLAVNSDNIVNTLTKYIEAAVNKEKNERRLQRNIQCK